MVKARKPHSSAIFLPCSSHCSGCFLSGSLDLGMIDIWDQVILWGGGCCPIHCRFSRIPGLYPLEGSTIRSCHKPKPSLPNVPWGQKSPQLIITALYALYRNNHKEPLRAYHGPDSLLTCSCELTLAATILTGLEALFITKKHKVTQLGLKASSASTQLPCFLQHSSASQGSNRKLREEENY